MEIFCSLVVLGTLVGLVIWAVRRSASTATTKASGGRDPRWDDHAMRDRDEADKAERTVQPEDISRAEAVIDQFGRSLQDSDAVYRSFADISRAGGAGTFEETIKRTFHDPGLLDRPWWWLAVVAERATSAGRPMVAAKIGAFTEMFTRLYLPHLNLAGSMDAGLSAPPATAQVRIGAAALAALPQLQPQQNIFGQIAGHSLRDGSAMSLTVGSVEQYIATTLVEIAQKGTAVSPAALERANVVLASNR